MKMGVRIAKKEDIQEIRGKVSTIYIVGKTISDLLIFEKGIIRKRRDEEWAWYFRNILCDNY
jgi:hypothetical protein